MGKVSFTERFGKEVAHLLGWFVDTHSIPKTGVDGQTGGIAVMGWSAGAVTSLAMLGYPEAVGAEAYKKLEPYYRKLILYGDSRCIAYLISC